MTQLLTLLTALAVVAGLVYVVLRPRWAVVIILVMFPLEQALQGYFPILATHGKLVNATIGVLALFAMSTRFSRGERPTSGLLNTATIGAFGLYALTWVGLLWTPSNELLGMLMFGLPYVALLLIATQLLIDDVEDFHRLALGVMIVGSVIAAVVMLNPSTTFKGGRLTLDIGLYAGEKASNPLALATMGGLMAVMAILIQFDRPRPFHQLLRVAAFALGLGLAIQSGSRGQVIAAVAVGVLFYPLARQVASVGQFFLSAFGYAFLFFALYVVFNLFVGDWNQKRWDFDTALDVTGGRMDNVRDLLAAYMSEPSMWLFGLGPAAFQPVTGASVLYVHNQPVEVLCELGIVGAALYIVVVVSVVRGGLWLLRVYRADPVRRGAAATLCGLVAYSFIVSLKQGSITLSGPTSLMWFVVLGRIVAHERRLHEDAAGEVLRAELESPTDWEPGPNESYDADHDDQLYGDYGDGYIVAR